MLEKQIRAVYDEHTITVYQAYSGNSGETDPLIPG